MMKRTLIALLCICGSLIYGFAQAPTIQRIDPTNWWAGMKNPDLQLLIYDANLKGSKVNILSAPSQYMI